MALYSIIPGGDFGIAVIIFTILMRLLLWPLVKKQLHQVKAMRKLQPELVKLKKQSKGNKQVEGMMMLELYKKHNVNPFRSIGILLIQLPIFIGLYHVIQIFTQHRNELAKYSYDFIESIPAVAELIKNPESFNQNLFGVIDLTRHAIDASGISPFLLVLAVGAGVLQYISSKQTMPQNETKKGLREIMAEAAEGKQADQAEMNAIVMQKMVKIMPIMMVLIMLNLPGAIALYYAVSTLVAVLQQHILLQRDEEELEEIADEGAKKQAVKTRAKQATEAAVVAEAAPVKKSKTSSKEPKNSKTSTKKNTKKASTKARTTVRVVSPDSKKKGAK
jgi:YidC/Oxa1 family membrane protein insertase